MRVLLDTHAFLWWITHDPRLSLRAFEIIADGENTLFLSAASGWEIATKAQLGRLGLPEEPAQFVLAQLVSNAIESLPIRLPHALHVYTLPPYHHDPFDRILVAQSQLEDLPILTADTQIKNYDVDVIW